MEFVLADAVTFVDGFEFNHPYNDTDEKSSVAAILHHMKKTGMIGEL